MIRFQLVSLKGGVLGVLLVWAASCSPSPEEVPLPDTTPPNISILFPRESSTVVDTVQVTIQASDDQGVARVTLLVDGATEEARYAPPWVFFWATGAFADSSVHCLQAEAVDQAGNLSLSAERFVSVLHNSPPVVRILWPPDGLWIDLDCPCEVWLCQAEDPEEGRLEGDEITWFLDGLALDQHGLSILPSPLLEGPHELAIVAADAWGRAARAEVSITAFRYPGATDPARTMERFLCALRARDATVAADCLSDAFTLVFPGA
ncbi:MAG: hypothetical protein KAY24_16420, partial [Candidatus Eisenbacteria sp.]|nr:hypothetical protein [Candidatus Eisenbacteria bacterium]